VRRIRTAATAALLSLAMALGACTGDRDPDADPAPGAGTSAGPTTTAAPADEEPAPSAPTTYVLATDGDDGNAGTEQEPWRTFSRALPRLRPGDELLVRGGTYRERVRDLSLRAGTPEARITVRAFPGEEPVLAGLLWLDRPSYWTFSDLHVTWDDEGKAGRKDHMVKITDGVGWRVERSELSNAKSFAALLVASSRSGEPSDWAITGNCVHGTRKANGTNQDHLLYLNPGLSAGPGTVSGNLLYDAPNGAGLKLGGSDDDEGGAAGVTVERNTVWGAAQSILVSWQSEDNVLADNLLGGTSRRYGAIRGYRLSGSGNVARGNVAADTEAVLLNDEGHEPVDDGGGNVLLRGSPGFDDTGSCSGFRPSEARAARVGHLTAAAAGG
jgi:hypothetical protein